MAEADRRGKLDVDKRIGRTSKLAVISSCGGRFVVAGRGHAIRRDVAGAVFDAVVQDHSERLATCRPECAVVVSAPESWINVVGVVRVPGLVGGMQDRQSWGRDGVAGADSRGVWSDCE